MINFRNLFLPWLLIGALAVSMVSCSYGVNSYVKVIPGIGVTSTDAFRKLYGMVDGWPEFTLENKCEESRERFMYKYKLRKDGAIFVALVFNAKTNALAFGYGQLGVKEFSQDAKQLFQELLNKLKHQFGEENIIIVSENDVGGFVSLLKGGDQRIHFCGE